MSVPAPEAYLAPVPALALPVASASRGSSPSTVTFSLNLTAMSIDSPAAYVLFCAEVETSTTYAGDRRISWTPWSKCAATMAYMSPSISNASTPEAPWRLSKPFVSSFAHPAAERVPSSSWMRTSWTPRSLRAATMAYVVVSTLNVSMACAPWSSAKLVALVDPESTADPAGERVPSSLMRTSWTPLPLRAATMAYMVPSLASNAEMSCPPASLSKPSSSLVAESAAERVPSSWMRSSWTPASVPAATMAYAEPLPALNMSTPLAPART